MFDTDFCIFVEEINQGLDFRVSILWFGTSIKTRTMWETEVSDRDFYLNQTEFDEDVLSRLFYEGFKDMCTEIERDTARRVAVSKSKK